MSPVCLIVQPIHPVGVQRLRDAGLTPRLAASADMATVSHELADATAVITRSAGLTAAAMDAAPRLRVIGSHGIGVDAIAVDRATALGIPVVNTPEANRDAVAEHTIALMLGVTKRLVKADAATRAGDFEFKYKNPTTGISGKVLGIVGFGGIGRRVAKMARQGFAMGVMILSGTTSRAEIGALGYREAGSLDALLAEADVVSLHRVSMPNSRRLIGEPELARMKSTAVLINTARGALIDEAALAAALKDFKIAGAGLDVFESEHMPVDHPLLSLPNVVLSPHCAGSSNEALERTAEQLVERVVSVLHGVPMDVVNSEVWERRRR
jgi:D-3-phosphoglycerate dehydrogenase / 2-oxoglutarate reductase